MEMPKMEPIRIETKGEIFLIKIWRWITHVRSWKLVEDWTYEFEDHTIVVPKKFEFDGASIPKLLWFILSPTGLLLIPGLIHDFGYRYDYLWASDPSSDSGYKKIYINKGQKFWDHLFYKVGKEVNGIAFINFICWIALTLFGWFAWRSNRKEQHRDIDPVKNCL